MKRLVYLGFTLLTLAFVFSCQKEVSFETAQQSLGTLQSTAGDCLPKRVGGVYKAAQVLNDSNYLEVTVNVARIGTYTLSTDTLNGYYFKGTGNFTATGAQTVRLKGSGTPQAQQDDDFTVLYGTSACFVTVSTLGGGASSGGSAIYTLQGSGSTCMNYTLGSGTYTVGTSLSSANSVNIQVNVTTPGTWNISTATVDGFFYSGSGTFTATGVQSITLRGSGTPATAGNQTFSVTAGSASCTFPVTVTGGTSSGCATVAGTYTAGTALATGNTISLTHTYAAAGSYTVRTNTNNGYSFGPASTTTSTAGSAVTLTLSGVGTPTTAGTNTFTLDFGDGQTCTFTVTVSSIVTPPVTSTDYFPLTPASWWSYDDGVDHTDTFTTRNSYAITFNGNSYRAFISTDGVDSDTSYYRKDASGNYYSFIPQSSIDPSFPITFTGPGLDINFLKQPMNTGDSLVSDHTGTVSGLPLTLRFTFKCINNNTSITVNGRTFINVYQIRQRTYFGTAGSFQESGDYVDVYYAKGIGLIRAYDSGATISPYQDIRNWVVN